MSMFALKLIAALAMLIDHLGCMYGIYIMRVVGRLAYPIFAFLVVNGFFKTGNKWKYLFRMTVFAVVSEIPFDLCFRNCVFFPQSQNVYFTLALGLLCLITTDEISNFGKYRILEIIPTLVFMCAAELIASDYGWSGILMIMLFYSCYDKKTQTLKEIPVLIGLAGIILLPVVYENFEIVYRNGFAWYAKNFAYILNSFQWQIVQLFRLCAVPMIGCYNGKKGAEFKNKDLICAIKYGFYVFYPLHLLILYLL